MDLFNLNVIYVYVDVYLFDLYNLYENIILLLYIYKRFMYIVYV